MSFQIGDRVQVGSRIGAKMVFATVVDVLPALADRVAMYRVRFDEIVNRDGRRSENVASTQNPRNECWVDEELLYGPFHDQDSPYYHQG